MQYSKTDTCRTISAAVEQLMRSLDRSDLNEFRGMNEEDIPLLHFGLGQYIPNILAYGRESGITPGMWR